MRVVCNVEELKKAAPIVARAFARRAAYDFPRAVVVETAENGVELRTATPNSGVALLVPAEVEGRGTVALPAGLFGEVVENLPAGRAEIRLNPDGTVGVLCERIRFDLCPFSPEGFPHAYPGAGEPVCSAEAPALRALVRSVAFAAADESETPALTGVLLALRGNILEAVASDGVRLAVRRIEISNPAREWSGIVPREAALELGRFAEGVPGTLSLEEASGRLVVRGDGAAFWTELVSGKFPEYGKFLSSGGTFRIRAGYAALRDACRRVGAVSRDARGFILLRPASSVLALESNVPEVGSARDELDISSEGTPSEVAVGVRYLAEGLAAMDGLDDVVVRIDGPNAPVVLAPPEGNEYAYVVAPVRVPAPVE